MYKGVGRPHRVEKPQKAEFVPDHFTTTAPFRGEDNVQFSRRTNSLSTHDSSCINIASTKDKSSSPELRQNSSNRANGMLIQTLIDEEVSKEMKSRQHSPSVVAKLMGLDTLPPPPQVAHNQWKNVETRVKSSSCTRFPGKFVQPKDNSCQKSNNEDEEFKDIFEVMETTKFRKHKKQPARKALENSKGSETELNFLRQKFMDVKRLSTDETFQNSKEFDDALEILHSNKDLFLEILQDRNAVFANHLEDVNHVPVASRSSQITVLKSSRGVKSIGRAKSERKCESYSHMDKEVPCSVRKSTSQFRNCAPKEYWNSVPRNSSSPLYTGKTEALSHPTRIVVLKPSLGRTQKMFGPLPFPHNNFHFDSGKHNESVASSVQDIYKEGRERQKLSDNVSHLGYKTTDYRQNAMFSARRLRHTRGSHSKSTISSELKSCRRKEGLYRSSDPSRHDSSELHYPFPNQLEVWTNNSSPSYSCSTESSVSREARKRMSERWKTTHQFRDVQNAARLMSTLGEMLALSDSGPPNASVVSWGTKNVSDDEFAGYEVPDAFNFASNNFSWDCAEDESSTKLRRSKSLPAASTAHENTRLSCREQGADNRCYMLKDVLNMSPDEFSDISFEKPQKLLVKTSGYHADKHQRSQSVGEENKLPELEIHVNSKEVRKSIHVEIISEENVLHSTAMYDETVAEKKHLMEPSLLPICEDKTSNITSPDEDGKQFFVQLAHVREELSTHIDNNSINKDDCSPNHKVDPHLFQSEISEAGLVLNSKGYELPSPVSILEPPSEEESSCSGCFERISADLQELRMQLNLLKRESAEMHEGELGIIVFSDAESAANSQSVLSTRELSSFRDEDDRDLSYLLDILIMSGIHGANQDIVSAAICSCSLNPPVGPDVFEKLEKKYGMLESWFRTERKLLFDLVNSIILGIAAPSFDLHSCLPSSMHTWKCEDLVEGIWQMVVKHRKELDCSLEELILDPRWLDVGDGIEVIVNEMERMLDEDILDEVLAEFIVG